MSKIPAFGPWSEEAHTGEHQEKSLAKARLSETTPLSVDTAAQTAIFHGSGKKPYTTSLTTCTCSGFVLWKLPCKHIYRLAMELGIISLPYKTGISKGERLEMQLSFADSVAVIESLSDDTQLVLLEMLGLTSDKVAARRNPVLVTNPAAISELRSCPLLEEQPAAEMILSRMKRTELGNLVAQSGVGNPPAKNSSKAILSDWLLRNVPNLDDLLPPHAAFSFIVNFDKAQRSSYQYLLRKYTDDLVFLADGTMAHVPHSSRPPDLSISISPHGQTSIFQGNPDAFYFPDDTVTALLTKYGCNRCLYGFIPVKQP